MPPYKIHVMKAIFVNDDLTELFDHLYQDFELPFVPFIGLALSQVDGRSCDPIETLTWNGEKQMFVANIKTEAGDEDRTAEDIRHWDMNYSGWLSYKTKTEK